MILRILFALVLLVFPSLAFGQCNGVFPAQTLCGNNTGSPAIPGAFPANTLTGVLPTPVRAGDVVVWNGSTWGSLAGNNSGTQFFVENSSGTPAWAGLPTRAGDIMYWNGSAWVTIAGNNSGTNFLSENASGVPSWASAVTSVTCGTGLSGGTITATGTCAVNITSFTNSLGADVALNNTGAYIDGPSVAQGTTGTWFASGTVTLTDTGGAANMNCRLWDGTTIIASAQGLIIATGDQTTVSLSGVITSPAANIRISVNDATHTTGKILFNASGSSKDSTVTAFRIQ